MQEEIWLQDMSYKAIVKTPLSVLQAVCVATSVQESELMIMACACSHYSHGSTACEAFNVKLSSTMQRGQGRAGCNAGHLPTLVVATPSVTFQSRQVSSGMRMNSRIWAGARTCPKMSVHESRELVWSSFCPSELIWWWSNRLLQGLELWTARVAVPSFRGPEGETKEFKDWSDKWAEDDMGLGEEKQKRLE